jgi:hypothetical protein
MRNLGVGQLRHVQQHISRCADTHSRQLRGAGDLSSSRFYVRMLVTNSGGGDDIAAEVQAASQQLVQAIIGKGSPQLQYLNDRAGRARLVCQRCGRPICDIDPDTAQPCDTSGPVILHICPKPVELNMTDMEVAGLMLAGSSSSSSSRRRCGLCRLPVSSCEEVHLCSSSYIRHYVLEMTQLGKLLPEGKEQLLLLRKWQGRVVMLYNNADFGAAYLPQHLRDQQLQSNQLPALEVCHLWQCRSQMLVKAGMYLHNMGLVAMHPLQRREVALTRELALAACRLRGADHTPALTAGGILFAYTGIRLSAEEAAAREEQEDAAAAAPAAPPAGGC